MNPTLRSMLVAVTALVAILVITSCGSSEPAKPAPDPRSAFEPGPGRYKYSTRGFETVDALLGARHRYPSTTRVTVTHQPCGYAERWVPRRERRLQFNYCVSADGSRRLRGVDDFHEFFGYPEALHYACKGQPVPALAHVGLGFRWTDRCKAPSTSLILHGKVIERVRVRVGAARIATVLLRIDARSQGKASGRNVNNSWFATSNGLLVRRSVHGTAVTNTPIGKVKSKERFQIKLAVAPPGTS